MDGAPSKRVATWTLAVLLIAAFALRLWFASGWPNASRSWDERYSLENVRSLLVTGSLEPVRNFYPSPVYFVPPTLAIQAVRPFVDNPRVQLFDPDNGRFGPTAYHLGRGIQAVYGTASILLIYLLCVMLFDRATGLLAATTLAFIPWFVQVSGIFKPDAQVVFFILAVFLAGARWMRTPSPRAALVVGVAVALATSSKLIAGLTGVAFGLGALLSARGRRQYAQIVLAGATSIVIFLALNPHIGIVLEGLDRIKWDYARRARWAGMTHAEIPGRTIDYLTAQTVLGPLLGTLALVGLTALGISVLRTMRTRPGDAAGPRLMIVSFPLVYVAVHTAQSAWFRDNNFTHILPSLVVALAWMTLAVLHSVVRRFELPRLLPAAAAIGMAALVVPPGVLFVYRTYTPSTLATAARSIGTGRHRQMQGRVVIAGAVEAPGDHRRLGGREIAWQRHWPLTDRGVAIVRTPLPLDLSRSRRWLSDAQILRGDLTAGLDPTTAAALEVIRPHLWELRGPAVTLVKHRWRRRATHGPLPIRWAGDNELEVDLPAIEGPRHRSLSIFVARSPATTPDGRPTIHYGKSPVHLHRSDLRDRSYLLVSERWRIPESGTSQATVIGLPQLDLERLEAHVYVWAPPALPKGFSSWPEWFREIEEL